jgi:hypothetical protein
MSRCRFVHAFDHHNMTPGPAGTAIPQVTWRTEDGILDCYGTTVPTDGDAGYSPGCHFKKIDGSTLDTVLYVNIGTNASCNFDAALLAS